jgi:hypothetical protein
MSKRWSATEKRQLLKMYAEGNSFDAIGNILDRSPNAIKLRLEEIVYSNLVKGHKLSLVSRMLKTNPDTIKQFYYSHKSFRQGKNKEVVDVDFNEYNIKPIFNNNINRHSVIKHKKINQSGGNHLEKIENDNKFLEAVIKNHRMKKYVKKLYIEGKLDNISMDIFNDIVKN